MPCPTSSPRHSASWVRLQCELPIHTLVQANTQDKTTESPPVACLPSLALGSGCARGPLHPEEHVSPIPFSYVVFPQLFSMHTALALNAHSIVPGALTSSTTGNIQAGPLTQITSSCHFWRVGFFWTCIQDASSGRHQAQAQVQAVFISSLRLSWGTEMGEEVNMGFVGMGGL